MRPLLDNFIYLEDKNIVFVYVPKVACTNWKCILRYLSGQDDYLNAALAHDRQKSGLVYLSERSDKDKIIKDQAVKFYSFVRNPYSRVLSAFRNKIEPFDLGERNMLDQDFWTKTFLEIKIEVKELFNFEGVDFLHFLKWLKYSDHFMTKNEHWLPQSDILAKDIIEYDFIGKMENIADDSAYILRQLKCNLDFPSQSDVKFPGTNSSSLLKNYYKEDELKIVESIYQNDFEQFGYDFMAKEVS